MSRNLLIILVISVISVISITLIFVSSSNSDKGQDVALDVPARTDVVLEASASEDSYQSGEEVDLNINLTNRSETDICLSEGAIGNIKFTSFSKDGKEVETRSASSYFITSFSEILKSRLVSVAPGDNIDFNLASSFDPGLDAQALSTTMPEDTIGLDTFYNIEEPGQYEVDLVYEYVGEPSDECENILDGSTNVATVTFKVEK